MYSLSSQPRDRFRGFSLAELLVSIAVIGALVAILMPVAGRVREAVVTTRCLTNLRQVGVALNSYANDKQQFYPPTYSSVRNPKNLKTWMEVAAPYAGYPPNAIGNSPKPRAIGIFYCPKITEEEKAERRVAYFYNSAIVGVNIRRQPLSPRTFLLVEGQPANLEALSKIAFFANPPDRHPPGGANFLCVDGSVETLYPPFNADDPRWANAGNE